MASSPSADAVQSALATVTDPEINRPITEIGMVKSVDIAPDGRVAIGVYLTTAACPLRGEITTRVTKAVGAVAGVTDVAVTLDVMNDEQRTALRTQLRGNVPERDIPFARPESLTRVYGVASGKGGVGKSSVTVNLAVALAAGGLNVGLLDADIYGHSVPRMLGLEDRGPTQVESMLMPPQAYGVKVISTGMFTKGNQPVTWRGPMLHRALQQFLSDVFWGDLDVLLLDLPTRHWRCRDFAGPAAARLRAATGDDSRRWRRQRWPRGRAPWPARPVKTWWVSSKTWPTCRVHTAASSMDVFGSGRGCEGRRREVSPQTLGHEVPLLGQIPLGYTASRRRRRRASPLVLSEPDSEAGKALQSIADRLSSRSRGLVRALAGPHPDSTLSGS